METYEILSVSELINIPAFVSSASACLRELFIILKTFVNISSAHSRGIVESHCTISELQEYFECNFHCLEQNMDFLSAFATEVNIPAERSIMLHSKEA